MFQIQFSCLFVCLFLLIVEMIMIGDTYLLEQIMHILVVTSYYRDLIDFFVCVNTVALNNKSEAISIGFDERPVLEFFLLYHQ